MKQSEIVKGGLYLAKVNGAVVTVRVDEITTREGGINRPYPTYKVTNLKTGRKTTFRSAAKFRQRVTSPQAKAINKHGEQAKCLMVDHEYKQDAMRQEDEQSLVESSNSNEGQDLANGSPSEIDILAADVRREDGWAKIGEPPTTEVGKQLAKIARPSGSGRKAGTTVAGMIPTDEQQAILEAASEEGLRVLVICAGAGCGKTAQLRMLEETLAGQGQYTAFNKSIVVDSKSKFRKAACNTTHSLAFRAVGCRFAHRLDSKRIRSSQMAGILGIQSIVLTLGEETNTDGSPRTKHLSADFLAGQVMVAIRKFCQSADRQLQTDHFRFIDGIDSIKETEDGRKVRSTDNNRIVREHLLLFARKAWADLSDVNGVLPYNADCYVKTWQLGEGKDKPVIAADYILLDEAQDTAPVFLDILKQQTHALLVLVGDDNQTIYEWRGAVNAMTSFEGAPRKLLSQSYRFGQAIADVANAILATLDVPTDLVMRGLPSIPSRVVAVAKPTCYLYRTNAAAVGRVMSAIAEGLRPHLIGGGADVVAFCKAAIELQAKRSTSHPELCCFYSWREVQEYSQTDEGEELRLMVKLIDEFTAEAIRDALQDMPEERNADMVVSTAHKSKGREWESVKLGQDFPTANRMQDSDRRLLYVAATRAKLNLDMSACPTFCGGYDGRDTGDAEKDRWVPGLRVAFTQPMPTQVEQDDWVLARTKEQEPAQESSRMALLASQRTPARDSFEWCQAAVEEGYGSDNPPPSSWKPGQPTSTPPGGNGASGQVTTYTWTSFDGVWCVRGPAEQVGQQVIVSRKDGSTSPKLLKSVARRFNDCWIYTV